MLQISIQRTQTVFRTITTLEIPTNGLRKRKISQKACAERTCTQRACKVRKCKAVRLWRSSDKGRHIFAGAGGRIYRPKVQKAFDKSEKNRRKLQKAKDKMPTKRQYEMKRVFDEQTGKAKYVVVPVDVEKPFKPDGLGKLRFTSSRPKICILCIARLQRQKRIILLWRAHTRRNSEPRIFTTI